MIITDEMQNILECEDHLIVLGGPGSGKTTVGLCKADVFSTRLKDHQRVLFLSFSRSAVYQIARASQSYLSPQHRDKIEIRTFHSLFWQLILSFGGFLRLPNPRSVILPEDAAVQKNLFPGGNWKVNFKELADVQGRVALELFATFALQIIQKQPQVLRIFNRIHPLIIVDEFQDTDEEEYEFIKSLSNHSQLICLADHNQRIYDFRPGVTSDRLTRFMDECKPHRVDLKEANHRNQGTEILKYGNEVLKGTVSLPAASGITIDFYGFNRQCGVKLKYAYIALRRELINNHGIETPTIAIVAATNEKVKEISSWLRKPTPRANFQVYHQVDLEYDKLMFSWRLVAILMSIRGGMNGHVYPSMVETISNFYGCSTRLSDVKRAKDLSKLLDGLKSGEEPKSKYLSDVDCLVKEVARRPLKGIPRLDANTIANILSGINSPYIKPISELLNIRLPFENDRFTSQLTDDFKRFGYYIDPLSVLQRSVSAQRLQNTLKPSAPCTLMTLHKCKGKEFDGIIIFDGGVPPHSLLLRQDTTNYEKSRRLLRVAITRARKRTVILMPRNNPSPIIPTILPSLAAFYVFGYSTYICLLIMT